MITSNLNDILWWFPSKCLPEHRKSCFLFRDKSEISDGTLVLPYVFIYLRLGYTGYMLNLEINKKLLRASSIVAKVGYLIQYLDQLNFIFRKSNGLQTRRKWNKILIVYEYFHTKCLASTESLSLLLK